MLSYVNMLMEGKSACDFYQMAAPRASKNANATHKIKSQPNKIGERPSQHDSLSARPIHIDLFIIWMRAGLNMTAALQLWLGYVVL